MLRPSIHTSVKCVHGYFANVAYCVFIYYKYKYIITDQINYTIKGTL
jgi:hypothetical protein